MADSVSRLVLCVVDAELMKLRTNGTFFFHSALVESELSVTSPSSIVGSFVIFQVHDDRFLASTDAQVFGIIRRKYAIISLQNNKPT